MKNSKLQIQDADTLKRELQTRDTARGNARPTSVVEISNGQRQIAEFANVAECAGWVAFTNHIEMDGQGWAQLAPFGDYPGQALVQQADGSTAKFSAIQRLDRAAAEAMVAHFKSPWHRLKRYFTGCNIYAGHPDVPAFVNEYPDKTPKGMIVDLQVRANGLFCKPVFTNEGSELVETRKLRAFSAYWTAREIGEQPGPDGRRLKIFRPDALKSAGLTNHPNLPVQLLNELPADKRRAQPVSSTTEPQPHPNEMNKQIVINFLSTQGITVANEATDAQITSELQQIGERVTVAETTLAARSLQLETLGAELANERQFHVDALLDGALQGGCITAAQRPEWAAQFAADFANASAALARLTPVLKTQGVTLQLGARKAEIANATERRDALDTLIKAEMAGNGRDYDRAFATVQKANPALFAAMKQPHSSAV